MVILAPAEVVSRGRFRICLLSTLLHSGCNNRNCPVKRDYVTDASEELGERGGTCQE